MNETHRNRASWTARVVPTATALTVLACGAPPIAPQHADSHSRRAPNSKIRHPPKKQLERPKLLEACLRHTSAAKQRVAELVRQRNTPTIDNTLRPLDDALRDFVTAGMHGMVQQQLGPRDRLQDDVGMCRGKAWQLCDELLRNPTVYRRLKALEIPATHPRARRVAKLMLQQFEQNGVNLPAAVRQRLKKVGWDMGTAFHHFRETIRTDSRALWASEGELAGVSKIWLEAHPPDRRGRRRIDARNDSSDLLSSSQNADSRRRLWSERMHVGHPKNESHLKQLLELRREEAKLLGRASYADFQLVGTMAGSVERVEELFSSLAALARPRAQRELRRLLARKRKDDSAAQAIEPWDRRYYQELVAAELVPGEDVNALPYFGYSGVRDGLLGLTSKLFELRWARVKDDLTWHRDVDVYDVFDTSSRGSGRKLGRVFLDLRRRPNKPPASWAYRFRSGRPGGRVPLCAIVANFDERLSHANVITFFHEFGHVLHFMFSGRNDWHTLTNTEGDFVEVAPAPLEEWARDYQVVKQFAEHHETGRAIPLALVARSSVSREVGRGLRVLFLLHHAELAVELHRATQPVDPARVNARMVRKYQPYTNDVERLDHLSLVHLATHGATLYMYNWADALKEDLMKPFRKHGLLHAPTVRRYRDEVLRPGGLRPSAEAAAG